ncbi:MAG: CRTAC1 family protein [Myxococcota bacterium]|nr:CRTAC1 family protein [Myxococcota bacterium]
MNSAAVGVSAIVFGILGCGEPGPLILEVDPSIETVGSWPDKSDLAETTGTWDSFKTSDSLNDLHEIEVQPPNMMLVAQRDRFSENPVRSILQQGNVNFWVVSEFYRRGILRRDQQEEIVSQMEQMISESPEESLYKVNAIIGLIHIGFDESALELVARYQEEPWFKTNYSVNHYAGSLLFRYREYDRALPFLQQAYTLHEDNVSRMWLSLAMSGHSNPEVQAEGEALMPIGEHMGGSDGSELPFRDQADRFGIRRWQLAGAVSFVDIDNDTHLDLVANGAYSAPELYRYSPRDGFTFTEDEGLGDIHNTPPGMAAADFDNDGYVDLYLTQAAWFSQGPNRMLRNKAGTGFEDVSNRGDSGLMNQNSCGVSALDFDRDGLVDLAVTGTSGGTLHLLRNMGNFEFRDVSREAGIREISATAVGLAVGDVDGDGWDDIFVNSFSPPYGGIPNSGFTAPNQLYINQKDGTFKEEGSARGLGESDTPMGFAAWMFDYDNDGDMDILASNFARPEEDVVANLSTLQELREGYQPTALYKNDGSGQFTNIGETAGFQPASIMGAQFIDFELDGDLDVVLGPGSHPLSHMQPLLFYRNDGEDRFTNLTNFRDPHFYGKFHGTAFADIDRDGDSDLFVNNGGVLLSDRWRDLFLENTTTGSNWVHLRLVGTDSNRSAIGDRVSMTQGERTLLQDVRAGQGFSSTNSPYLIFGLGRSEETGPVRISWPSGRVQELPSLGANQAIVVTEGQEALRRVY